ncbi:MAG: peptide deformylase [Gammaproteobacteria bacterium]
MALLEILKYPDRRLKQVSGSVERFDATLRDFVVRLEGAMRAGPGAVGIAAPQVGRFERIVIVDVSQRRETPGHGCLVLVNAEITDWDGLAIGREGCLSVPDYTGNVVRAQTIEVQARDVDGVRQTYACEGFEARAIQHELDHLDGVLFLDRLVSRRNDLFRRKVYQ